MTYPSVALGDIVDIKGGKRLSKGDVFLTEPTNHPYIRAQDIRAGKVNPNDLVYITDKQYSKIKNYIANADDVCITIVGANVGDVGVVPKELDGANLTENAVKLVNAKNCERKYVMYCLLSYNAQAQMKLLAGGAAQPKLGIYKIAQVEIPLPPLPTQRRIADILSAYDDLIENNMRRIRILEQMAQAIYQEWFGKVDKESLPEGWKTAKIEDYGDVITGKTPSKAVDTYWNSRDVPFIRTPDMHNQFYCIETTDYVSTEGANSQKNAFIPPNSLCVSCIGTVGIVTITPIRAQTNQQINSVVLNDLSDLEFLYFKLLGLKETFQSYAAAGATMANLSKGKFMAVNVQCPPKELREKFHAVASPMFEQIKNLQYKNANLRQARDLLLPRLVSGEVEV